MEVAVFHDVLKNVKSRLKNRYNWDDDFTNGAIDEYYRFMVLVSKFPKLTIVPGKVIDEVWHDHILHTKDYIEFCNKYFGDYLHHSPRDGSDEIINFDETVNKYLEIFGRLPPRIYWFSPLPPKNTTTMVVNSSSNKISTPISNNNCTSDCR
ncbi:Hypothetical protein HVR_LOCUS988 [uncultured virus]|nr:Hypothetical protein HVR_LOCUS988 [uncultured virus]